MTTYLIVADDTIPAPLAVATLKDSFDEMKIVWKEDTAWGEAVKEAFALTPISGDPYYTSVDTVVGPPIEEYVAKATEAGATYLDISQGLVAIAMVNEEDVPESPDTENVPEAPPVKKATPKKRTKREPLPLLPPKAAERPAEPVSAAPVPSAPPKVAETSEAALLRSLVELMLADASTDTLWSIAETLRSSR